MGMITIDRMVMHDSFPSALPTFGILIAFLIIERIFNTFCLSWPRSRADTT